MKLRKECPICGHIFTPYRIKQRVCRRPECQRQRQRETALEYAARLAEAEKAVAERLARRRIQDRARRMRQRQEAEAA